MSCMHALLPLNFLHCPGATWAIGRMRMVGGLGEGDWGLEAGVGEVDVLDHV